MNSNKLIHGLISANGQLVETYIRETKASDAVKQILGLATDEQILANIGLSSIEEYLMLESSFIAKGNSQLWDLSILDQPFKVESILIDSPYNDTFTLEFLDENNIKKYSQPFERQKTSQELPLIVIKANWKIQVTANNSDIDYLQIIGKPVALLESIYPSNTNNADDTDNINNTGNTFDTDNDFFLLGVN